MQKLLAKCRKANAGQTDRPTNRQTDIVPYRVALQATKNEHKFKIKKIHSICQRQNKEAGHTSFERE